MPSKEFTFGFVLSAAMNSFFAASFSKASREVDELRQYLDKLGEKTKSLQKAFGDGIINKETFDTAVMRKNEKSLLAWQNASMDMFRAAFTDWNIIIWYFTNKKTLVFLSLRENWTPAGFEKSMAFCLFISRTASFSRSVGMRHEVVCTAIVALAALLSADIEYRERRRGKLRNFLDKWWERGYTITRINCKKKSSASHLTRLALLRSRMNSGRTASAVRFSLQ